MNEFILQTQKWWLELNPREKLTVTLGGSVLVVILFLLLFWVPLLNHLDVMRKEIVTSTDNLNYMQAAEQQLAKFQGQTASTTSISPVMFLSDLQKKLDIAQLASSIKVLKQTSNDTITLKMEKVEFDKLMSLLLSIGKTQPVTISQMTVLADTTPGIANVDVVFKL